MSIIRQGLGEGGKCLQFSRLKSNEARENVVITG